MTESKDGNKIVLTTVLIGILVLTGAAVWALTNRKIDQKEKAEHIANLKSPHGSSGTDDSISERLKKPVPDFSFPKASGGQLGLADLKGKVWIAEFMFTNCAGVCPTMSKMTELLQERTSDLKDFHIVSFTVDPKNDTLEALKEYATEYKADDSRWHFLRATQKEVHEIGRAGFLLLNDTDALLHSKKVALVDKKGHIRAYFDGAGPERVSDFQALEAMARKLCAEEG